MTNVIIHKDNISFFEDFEDEIYFDNYDKSDIDRYISQEILPDLLEIKPDVIYIKDNLSLNYLELLGLRVAYHIRLTENLKYLPIVVISDLDGYILNKLDASANILFTKNTFLIQNTKSEYNKIKNKDFKNLTQEEYQSEFLDKIRVEQPKDYLSHHSIANEWSIYKWSDILDVKSEATQTNKEKIENLLYFKYLKVKQKQYDNENIEIKKPSKKGKVLLIDDEWDKGWSDILKVIFQSNREIEFKPFITTFKDRNSLSDLTYKRIANENSDVVILDLRFLQSDHETNDIDSYTGIKILKKIHEINAGIQVIMLTATSKSTILEKLYEKKILGYIKKEHPDDVSINTVENINKLVDLVDDGLEKKYLKEIWNIQQNNSLILQKNIFAQYKLNTEKNQSYLNILQNENFFIFDILDSSNNNRLAYAALSMARFLEAILTIFIDEKKQIFWDGEECKKSSVYNQLQMIIKKLDDGNETKARNIINSNLNTLIYNRNKYLHANDNIKFEQKEMPKWFLKLNNILEVIQNPPKLRVYDRTNLLGNLQNKFNN
ncbi:MAG: hypothetical protein CL623_05880 [Arcobacter sp.]|nr:hypothetical protein [Arcobacter sp.]|tara:strand:- start:10618 stop:12261 length:1644 start_codon:yes stop_codon:yes gene_type:complete